MRKFPDIGLIEGNKWGIFDKIYVATIDKNFLGICGIVKLKHWVKIGPVVVLKKFQGEGYGSLLLNFIVQKYAENNLYIGSPNSRIKNIVGKLGFIEQPNYWSLPWEIKKYFTQYLLERLSLGYILDSLYKIFFMRRGKYCYFLKKASL